MASWSEHEVTLPECVLLLCSLFWRHVHVNAWVHTTFIKRRREQPPSVIKARRQSAVQSIQLKAFISIKLASISRIAGTLISPSQERQAVLCLRVCVCVFVFVFKLITIVSGESCYFPPVFSPSPLYSSPPVSSQYRQRETNYNTIITPTVEVGTSVDSCCR